MILPKASCSACARAPGEIERFCLREMLGDLRTTARMPTRRPSQRRSQIQVRDQDAIGNLESREVPISQYPVIALGYRLPSPGILLGGKPDDPIEAELIVKTSQGELAKAKLAGKRVVLKLGAFNTLTFMRMLAKIGHSHAIAKMGLKAFDAFLPDLILGKSDAGRWLVGSDASEANLPATTDSLHDLWLEIFEGESDSLLVAGVRLFSGAGMPKYQVVVGRMR
jgi:hypothetical protein